VAVAALTIATSGDDVLSMASKIRPRSSGIFMASK
jgi:hypothetical protein